ncbi:TetR-like C-terminal domain-containing protein [Streptomyces sp. NPDC088732]|uniref:TetR-like C-terminal domain-containing protein n=1 Tax=Streptomyces sp. NPDC088732 TaxID=3365879 RepID=UPI0037F9B17C
MYLHVDSPNALRRGVGRSGPDAVRAIAGVYRKWGLDHPGRYAAGIRAPRPEDEENQAATYEAVRILFNALINGMRAEAGIGGPDTAPHRPGAGP